MGNFKFIHGEFILELVDGDHNEYGSEYFVVVCNADGSPATPHPDYISNFDHKPHWASYYGNSNHVRWNDTRQEIEANMIKSLNEFLNPTPSRKFF